MKIRTLALAALAMMLCGCVTATYTYTRTGDGGCTLVIQSKRDLANGFAGSIKRCDLIAETASATGGQFDPAQVLQIAAFLAPYLKQIPAQPAPAVVEQPK